MIKSTEERKELAEIISPQYLARNDYNDGLGQEANPYKDERYLDYALTMTGLQQQELANLMDW